MKKKTMFSFQCKFFGSILNFKPLEKYKMSSEFLNELQDIKQAFIKPKLNLVLKSFHELNLPKIQIRILWNQCFHQCLYSAECSARGGTCRIFWV